METVVLKGFVARKLREEASRRGLSLEEYMLEVLTQGLNSEERAREYIEAASSLLEEGREELEKGDLRQAAEKVWGAVALAVKAYALWRDGRILESHGELWSYKDRVARDLGDWVRVAFQQASSMHTCFYEGWCTEEDVEAALRAAGRLVEAVRESVSPAGAA